MYLAPPRSRLVMRRQRRSRTRAKPRIQATQPRKFASPWEVFSGFGSPAEQEAKDEHRSGATPPLIELVAGQIAALAILKTVELEGLDLGPLANARRSKIHEHCLMDVRLPNSHGSAVSEAESQRGWGKPIPNSPDLRRARDPSRQLDFDRATRREVISLPPTAQSR